MFMENDFSMDIARGKIPKITTVEKFGHVNNMGTSDAYDIVDGATVYSGFPTTTVSTLEILSDNTADKDGGTGARTVTLYNLINPDGDIMPDVTITLDGTTVVTAGTQEYFRCSRAKVRTAGSAGWNVGTLTVRQASTPTNKLCIVTAEGNRTMQMVYTVPKGKTLHITSVHSNLARDSGAAGSAKIALMERPYGEVFSPIKHPDITTEQGYDYEANHILVPARSDIKGHVFTVSDTLTHCYMEIAGHLIDD